MGPRPRDRLAGFAKQICRLSVVTLLFGWTSAYAQQATQPVTPDKPPNPQPDTTSVTVTGKALDYRSSIDRKTYRIRGDDLNSAGSLGDVLRHLPAVQVDPEGNVSLRGDPNVTILVDGKPSPLFSGPSRAQALQSMSPDQFDRVEVMTNPGAAQSAEGSGGVINLVSKAVSQGASAPSMSGSVKANLGSRDRFDFGGNGAYSAHGLSLSGGVSFRRSAYQRDVHTIYGLPSLSYGQFSPAEGTQTYGNRTDNLSLDGAAGYDLGARDHLDASISLLTFRTAQSQSNSYRTMAATDPNALDFTAPGFNHVHFWYVSEALGFTHSVPEGEQSLSAKLSLSQSHINNQSTATYAYEQPHQAAQYQSFTQSTGFPDLNLSIDYKRLLSNKAKLTFGYEFKADWQSEKINGIEGPSIATALPNPAFDQDFIFRQQVQALYATYEQSFGKLTFKPGLRLETTSLDTDLVSAGSKGRQTYFDAYPSLNLSYDLGENSQFKASYGRRVVRPNEIQLDPFQVYVSPTLYNAGNPNLRPAFTQSYELGYEFSKKADDWQATLFYRDKTDQLTTVFQDEGANVLLSTWQNIGRARDVGLELAVKHEFSRTLSLSGSTDIMRTEVNPGNLSGARAHSALVASGEISVNWQVAPNDFIQIGGEASGKQLTAQGYQSNAFFSDFGWRHRFDSRLASVLTATNPFGLPRGTRVIDTQALEEVEKRQFRSVAVFLGFTYALGAVGGRAPSNFDFDHQRQGAP